jgi:hypothetical protein
MNLQIKKFYNNNNDNNKKPAFIKNISIVNTFIKGCMYLQLLYGSTKFEVDYD